MKRAKTEFPHPLLSKNRDDYINCDFEVSQKELIEDNEKILITLNYQLSSSGLQELLNAKLAKVIIKLENNGASYRNIYEFEYQKNEITINLNKDKIVGDIEVKGYIIANTDIGNFSLAEHNKEYFEGVNFTIRKGDILAEEPGIVIRLYSSELEKPVASIFIIKMNDETKTKTNESIIPKFNKDKIEIILDKSTYHFYSRLRKKKVLRKYLSGVIIFPVLVQAIVVMQNIYATPADSENEYKVESFKKLRWFKAIEKKLDKMEIDISNTPLSPVTISSKLLGDIVYSAVSGLKETIDELLKSKSITDESEEE